SRRTDYQVRLTLIASRSSSNNCIGNVASPFRPQRLHSMQPVSRSLARVGLRRAAGLYALLNWRARYRTVGTENAAASWKRLKCRAAAYAVVTGHAGIGRNGFSRLIPANADRSELIEAVFRHDPNMVWVGALSTFAPSRGRRRPA